MTDPPSGLDLRTGDHVGAFFWGVEGRDEVMLPFLRAGLRAGDPCICVVHATEPAVVLEHLAADIEASAGSARLAVRPASETYLSGGRFSVTAMIELYESFVASTTIHGGVARVTGEGAWALESHPGVEHLIDYESELNDMVKRHPQMILCLYDLGLFGGSMMADLLKTHPKIILGGMLISNPHYRTPEQFRIERRKPST